MTSIVPNLLEVEMPDRVSLHGSVGLGPRPKLLISEDEKVITCQTLAQHRRHSWQRLVSPVSGRIAGITFGPHRSIELIEIAPDPDAHDLAPATDLGSSDGLAAAGLWHHFRSRPFDIPAAPTQTPRNILITGFFSDPRGPDPSIVMDDHSSAALFEGCRIVAGLAPCGATLVHVGLDPTNGAEIEGLARHAMHRSRSLGIGGLVRRFGPASLGHPVWYVDWQAVTEIGRIALKDHGPVRRFLTLRGPEGSLQTLRAVVGTPVSMVRATCGIAGGHLIEGVPALLREFKATGSTEDRLSLLNAYPGKTFGHGRGPIIPSPALEATLPQIPAPVLLLRALAMGDHETALRLGVLDLGAADVALCTHFCASGHDYAALWERMTKQIAEDAGEI